MLHVVSRHDEDDQAGVCSKTRPRWCMRKHLVVRVSVLEGKAPEKPADGVRVPNALKVADIRAGWAPFPLQAFIFGR